ncbi:MAG: VWA domain-containing protein, partial [Myxococcota bacterium]|nr:VWA domain-containing protein [Myxococcota bacterium]
LSLMRPQWGVEFIESRASGAEIMIALDVSRSMMAEDVVPNRLERAKAEIRDLLPYLDGDQVGLIAFAGRASVLCPLTPDFGFLRLILDRVEPGTVGRGGTRLEEPIRKATAGFGDAGDLARVILLITDGEDLDSFPVDAATEAAERGIHILAIGFGDEAGSEIIITDPVTGARQALLDGDGRPVISRLDGTQLREIAMAGQGAYIPAGTGLLDLESIFDAHIRPLMRNEGSETGRTVQREGFQWTLLLAWLALFTAVGLGSGTKTAVLLIVFASTSLTPGEVNAQMSPSSPIQITQPDSRAADPWPTTSTPSGAAPSPPPQPREALNAGLSALAADHLADAQSLFEAARQTAGGDGEVRYRATYDLGWVEVARADSLLASEPADALAALQRSADWFREAIGLRPEADAPRRNLEIVLDRILVLSDQLAEHNTESLEQRLDRIIDGQRSVNQSLRKITESLQFIEDPHQSDAWRLVFRRLALEERQLLDEARTLADSAATEQLNLEKESTDQPPSEDAMRRFQLEAAQVQLHRARERMGQARQQLKRRSAARAHRRSALALERLKRSREQLQDPILTLDGLLRDGVRLHEETLRLLSDPAPIRSDRDSAPPSPPPWLNIEYLSDGQASITERNAELDGRFAAALDSTTSSTDPEREARLAQVREASPFLSQAHRDFEIAQGALAREDLAEAERNQLTGLEALARAREQLLDLRGLIELTYRDEKRLSHALGQGDLTPPGLAPEDVDPSWLKEARPAFAAYQTRNLERTERLSALIEQARTTAKPSSPNTTAPPAAASFEAEMKRLDTADGLLAMTESSMRGALKALHQLGEQTGAEERSRRSIASALKGLEGLRRLFFSMVEHVRDVLRQQESLSDATDAAGGREEPERTQAVGPVAEQQTLLGNKTEALAEALHEQALEAAMAPVDGTKTQPNPDPEAAQQAADKLSQAAEYVLEAAGEMAAAAASLTHPGSTLEAARTHQNLGQEALKEALALLAPPPPPSDQPAEPEPPPSEQESESQKAPASDEEEEEESAPGEKRDPGQILQGVREREAERHRRRQNPSGYEPVDRDW